MAPLTDRVAAAMLRVDVDADEASVKSAFRSILSANHPDHGGSFDGADVVLLTSCRDRLCERARRSRDCGFVPLAPVPPSPFVPASWPVLGARLDVRL